MFWCQHRKKIWIMIQTAFACVNHVIFWFIVTKLWTIRNRNHFIRETASPKIFLSYIQPKTLNRLFHCSYIKMLIGMGWFAFWTLESRSGICSHTKMIKISYLCHVFRLSEIPNKSRGINLQSKFSSTVRPGYCKIQNCGVEVLIVQSYVHCREVIYLPDATVSTYIIFSS